MFMKVWSASVHGLSGGGVLDLTSRRNPRRDGFKVGRATVQKQSRGGSVKYHTIGVGTGGAAGAVAPATIKLGGWGMFLPPPTFCRKTKLQF